MLLPAAAPQAGDNGQRQRPSCSRSIPARFTIWGAAMSFDVQRLYELLPAIYRIRDLEQGGPLRALLAVIADEVGVIEENLDQLYDDQFIETCADGSCPTSAT